jgi:hypothetical protein
MDRTLVTAVRAGTAARLASASTRRRQIALMKVTLLMHTAQNHHHRRQVSVALKSLHRTCVEFRWRVRRQLTLIGARAAARAAR